MTKIAVLTGGGHISSFHAGMKGVCDAAEGRYDVVGFRNGYSGAKNGDYMQLRADCINPEVAGSFLGSTREKAEPEAIKKIMKELGIDAMIVMGGNDHLGEAAKLYEHGINVVGWPKTMDNDLSGTYFCFGYPTAVHVAANFLREAHCYAVTHEKAQIVTIFGRDTDWIVAGAGVWGAADIVVPGEKYADASEKYDITTLFEKIQETYERNGDRYGRKFAIIAVAEGTSIGGLENHLREDEIDVHGNTKIEPMKLAIVMKDALDNIGKKNANAPISIDCISYAMRNAPPCYIDRSLAVSAGRKCVDMINNGMFGYSSVITEDLELNIAPLSKVSKQRFLRPEGFIDYQEMTVKPEFAAYYKKLFGNPQAKEEVLRGLILYSK